MLGNSQLSAIALIAALMFAFAYLHLRFKSVRTLLWLLALGCGEAQAILIRVAAHLAVSGAGPMLRVWVAIAGESALILSSALFLASLSPLSFRIGRVRILYVIPFALPLLIYAALYNGVSQHPSGPLLWLYIGLAYWAAGVALIWSLRKGAIPVWLAVSIVVLGSLVSLPFFIRGEVFWPLLVVESGNMVMTSLLVVFTFRRLSPGVILATVGFLAWGLPPFFLVQYNLESNPAGPFIASVLTHAVLFGKIVVAMGLILLVLEDEVNKNQAAQMRERRVRLELEAYARQSLTARSLDEFDRGSSQLCGTIVDHSRFGAAALIARNSGGLFTLTGYAGMDGATAGALDALAQRLPSSKATRPSLSLSTDEHESNPGSEAGYASPNGSSPEPSIRSLVAGTTALDLDLTPWLTPGDDLERLRLTRVGAIPLLGPDNSPEGALLLTSIRNPGEQLRPDDLLPIEILASRIQAARSQALMLGKLIESERFAGVGQLATNVAQQLNNPLTVVLGYSALLEDSVPAGPDRRAVEAIAIEAQRMRNILERLSRFSKLTTERFNSFSILDLMTDIEQFHRTEFLRHSIEFRMTVEPNLPSIFGNAHQIRQALLHAMRFAIDCALRVDANQEKSVRLEASCSHSEDGRLQILVGHSGAGFTHPERAFDSLSTGFSGGEASNIGLSLCAAIVREHRGNISAVNYSPSGAAVLFDLPLS
jgi:signal transduction histidine kinase